MATEAGADYRARGGLVDPDAVALVREHEIDAPTVEQAADIFRALADPTRVRILHALSHAELCVGDLAAFLGMTDSAVSHQLRLLRDLRVLRRLSLSPRYMSQEADLVLARDLYPQRLPGDEPEELEVVPWKLDALHELVLREEFSEGRAVAALFMAREWLRHGR